MFILVIWKSDSVPCPFINTTYSVVADCTGRKWGIIFGSAVLGVGGSLQASAYNLW